MKITLEWSAGVGGISLRTFFGTATGSCLDKRNMDRSHDLKDVRHLAHTSSHAITSISLKITCVPPIGSAYEDRTLLWGKGICTIRQGMLILWECFLSRTILLLTYFAFFAGMFYADVWQVMPLSCSVYISSLWELTKNKMNIPIFWFPFCQWHPTVYQAGW